MDTASRFQILALSGGGFRGLYSARILEHLEKEAGKPLASCFDLMAGTSIGGIIALALSLEVPAAEIVRAFKEDGGTIFSRRPKPRGIWKWIDLRRFIWWSKYSDEGLKKTITRILGSDRRLGDAKHPIIIPSVNLTTGSTQFFKTSHHPLFVRDYEEDMLEVALATSAAPGFFPLARVGSSHFADGGLYVNSPDLVALHEAEHFLKIDRSRIRVLSVGTITSRFSFSHTIGRNLGWLNWAIGERLLSVIMSCQQQRDRIMMEHMLEEHYFRIDGEQSKEQEEDLGLDVATQEVQDMLLGMADLSAKVALGTSRLQPFLSHCAPPPHFYRGPYSSI